MLFVAARCYGSLFDVARGGVVSSVVVCCGLLLIVGVCRCLLVVAVARRCLLLFVVVC